jgi:tetratricopeptide (TPR) repeat protein
MLTLPLKIEYAQKPVGEKLAWLMPGDDAEELLGELVAAGVATASTALFVVPSLNTRRPRGVLVVPHMHGAVSRVPARWQPYTRLAERLYLPINAVLAPAIEESELAALLADEDCVYVFHPVVGLVAFDSARTLRVSDLLVVKAPPNVDWNHARPGIGFVKRLTAVEPVRTLDFNALLEAARDDIGSEAVDAERLPKSPLEPADGILSKLLLGGGAALSAIVRQLAKLVPKTATAPTWVNALQTWATKFRQRYLQGLDAIRNREILRLMQLLEKDPDEGLRYALPLSSDPHRGLGTPGSRLTERKVGYSGGRSGDAADLWNLEEQHRQRLHQQYRQLVTRELHLGRHGRAAYILANLLGDHAAAASALEQGRFFREAATIYRERLHRPQEAARCLERGGLLTEAITLYEELKEWETVGDLYVRIEQFEAAAGAFENAVAQRRSAGDHLTAARLLEQKLDAADRAADELWRSWPSSKQAAQCLQAYFDLLARGGKHDLAQKRVDQLSAQPAEIDQTVALVEQLARLATRYPSPEVQMLAADRTRVKIAGALAIAGEHRRRLVNAISQLVPADKLLSRDCQRFLMQQSARISPRVVKPARPNKKCELVKEFKLPDGVAWRSLVSGGDSFIAAGFRDRDLILVQGRWDGALQQPSRAPWRVAAQFAGSPILLEADRAAIRQVFVHVPGCAPFDTARVFPATDQFCDAVTAQSHPALSAHTLAMSCCPAGPFWQISSQNQRIVLSQYQSDGQLVSTSDVLDRQEPFDGYLSLLARSQRVYLAIDNVLHLIGGRAPQQIELQDCVKGLSGSAVHTRPRVAAVFERGGVVLWDDNELHRFEVFGKELESPLATFTQHGWLVAAAKEECHVYVSQDRKLSFKATGPGSATSPIAVMPTDHAHRYAVCDSEGRIAVFDIPIGGSI